MTPKCNLCLLSFEWMKRPPKECTMRITGERRPGCLTVWAPSGDGYVFEGNPYLRSQMSRTCFLRAARASRSVWSKDASTSGCSSFFVYPSSISSHQPPVCWINFATRPVQPVWWQDPKPAPLSPWKYSLNKIQNYSPKFSMVDAIPDIWIASEFTAHQ